MLVIAQGAIYIYEVVYSIIIEEGVFFLLHLMAWQGRFATKRIHCIDITSDHHDHNTINHGNKLAIIGYHAKELPLIR